MKFIRKVGSIIKLRDINTIIKLTILAYIAGLSFNVGGHRASIITLLLIYLITIFLKEIFNEKYFWIVICLEVTVVLFLTIKYIPSAIILLSITAMEYGLNYLSIELVVFVIGLLPLVYLIGSNKLMESTSMVVLIYFTLTSNQKVALKLDKLEKISENQRRETYRLQRKLKEEQVFREQFLYTAKLEERNKISGNLHDKIGHTISGTILQLEAIKIIMTIDIEKARNMLESSIGNLRIGMDDIRLTLRSIRPPEEELGINRIRLILEEKTKNTQLKSKISYKGDLEKIPPSLWMLFVQAVKELSTNSIKHSNGNLIKVKIEILAAIIKLEVKDNGQGASIINKGIGLINLEEKVCDLKGKVCIHSEDGFSVIILIPYK